jgi:MOSC domain-containing protein YiiM
MRLLSVNIGIPRPSEHSDVGTTSIDKQPVAGAVAVRAVGGQGGAITDVGLAGDTVYDVKFHGGHDQALYAYAREDLDFWGGKLGRKLHGGVFGENLTTEGLDVNGARIGERWRIGDDVVVEVSGPRIPCRTFAGWMDEKKWIKRFTREARSGAYLRVIEAGEIQSGDTITVVSMPEHDVTVDMAFRALTTESGLLPRLLDAGDALPDDIRETVVKRTEKKAKRK